MYVCVYIYIYIYIYTHMCIHTHNCYYQYSYAKIAADSSAFELAEVSDGSVAAGLSLTHKSDLCSISSLYI